MAQAPDIDTRPIEETLAGYQQGWQHGFEAGVASASAPVRESATRTKWLAAGALAAGLASAAFVVTTANPKYGRFRPAVGAVVASGLVLSAVLGAVNVLQGGPTPKLGLQGLR